MNEDGELLEDDVLYILDGILQDVIRHKFKTAIESIKETIERKNYAIRRNDMERSRRIF